MKNQLQPSQMQDAYVCAILSKLVYGYTSKHPHIAFSEEEELLASIGYGIDAFIEADGTELLVASSRDNIIFAYRGTKIVRGVDGQLDLNDLIMDLKAQFMLTTSLGNIGYGFRLHAEKVFASVVQLVRKTKKQIIFTGHSLGAAAAVDAGVQIRHYLDRACRLITFGCPRVGDRRFAWNVNRLFPFPYNQRWVNGNDIVTKLPFQFGRFRHPNALQYISTQDYILTSPSMGKVFLDRWGWFRNSWFRWATSQKEDHLIDNYINPISKVIKL